ncbi:hypothetical protein [Azospirillum picis]|uniref:Uncharacterized protein n=1 Tax=Azospirillum picis TaxID=488438 RepID=A0ABU0MI12_9PROT|nr:hypothetical protein [Azospirillum picis]MBP2298897.1 hypothetical protein [Azospirillum picis]MDQ0532861.1 hypothetical protein [Azospirillum picis]
MTKHIPPVPPEGRSDKGPGEPPASSPTDQGGSRGAPHTKEQGQPGNTHQNTTHQGYQQDR